ncbi:MAG TPA: hypothetical protein PKN50_08700 [Spirochaetota bacterium]|nr:hypothetical protein [Spirochaetota bacterium]HPV43316.1 hypothetical protein [Spirochaetota bacterium]
MKRVFKYFMMILFIGHVAIAQAGSLFNEDESGLKRTANKDGRILTDDAMSNTNSADSVQEDKKNNVNEPRPENKKITGDSESLNKSDNTGKPQTREDREKKTISEKKLLEKKEESKDKTPLSDVKGEKRHHVGFIAGYGGCFPVADYGKQYRSAHLGSFSLPVYYLTFWGFCPEVTIRYTDMAGGKNRLSGASNITQLQLFPAIMYRHEWRLPKSSDRFLILYGRVWDGVSRVHYKSSDPYYPFIKHKVTEYINTFGFSAGCLYDVYKGVLVGVDAGYGITFTAGKLLQSMSLTVNAGYRI